MTKLFPPMSGVLKFRICLKELKETKCWLRLVEKLNIAKSKEELDYLLQETEELIKIFVTSIRTAKTNAER